MQQFTRALTREITVGGERLAVTLDKDGLTIRPVGARRPPHTMSWAACLCACTEQAGAAAPSDEQVEEALKALRAGGPKPGAAAKEAAEDEGETEAPAPAASAAPAAPEGPPAHPPGPAPAPAPAVGPAPAAEAPRTQPSAERVTRDHPAPAAPPLTELLARIDRWLHAHRPRFARALRPGATDDELKGLAAALGGTLPDELRTWLRWHNGQDPDVPGALEGSWQLMSTQEIAEARKGLDTANHAGWDRAWVPLLGDGNDNYLCLDATRPGAPVRECWRGRAEHDVVAPSLAAWVKTFVTDLESGAYVEDPERGTFTRK